MVSTPIVVLAFSTWRIFLIALRVCDKKGIDVSILTSDQLDDIITLIINSVKQVFRENGFRFIPNIISPSHRAGKEVVLAPYKGHLGIPKPHEGNIVGF